MKAAIIGTGSMGTAIGAYITKAGMDVTMADANPQQVKALCENGSTVRHSDSSKDFTVAVSACLPEELCGTYDLFILTTKQTANSRVLPVIMKHMDANSVVCTLQNGIAEYSVAQTLGKEHTAGGSMLFGATREAPGVTRVTTEYSHFRQYAFQIGELDGPPSGRVEAIADILSAAGGVKLTDRLMDTKWSKLLVNCSRSGMSAALGCTFGEAADNSKGLVCSLFLAKECMDVCRAHGCSAVESGGENPNDYYWENKEQLMMSMERFKNDGKAAAALKASMLQDLEKNLPTEIDYINGFVAEMGRAHGISTPFNERVRTLVKEAEARGGVNDMSFLTRFDDLLEGYEDLYTP